MKKALLLYSCPARSPEADPSLRIAPVGLFFISGALRAHGYVTEIRPVFSGRFQSSDPDAEADRKTLQEAILAFGPDVIGYSFRNLYRQGAAPADPRHLVNYLTVSDEKPVVEFLRSISRAVIVGGGSAFSLAPDLYMTYMGLDYGVVGEGEVALPRLLDRLDKQASVEDIPGLVYRKGERWVSNPPEAIPDLSVLPPMDTGSFGSFYDHCLGQGGYANVQTKRGCAFRCIYCVYPFLEGAQYRLRDADRVVQDVLDIRKKHGADAFYFVDSVFSYPVDHAMVICRKLIDRHADIVWNSYMNPRQIRREALELFKASGCHNLVCTLDVVDETLLEIYRKDFSLDDIKRCIEGLFAVELPFEISIIVGGPGETEDTLSGTLDFCERYLCDVPVTFCPGLWLHPGAPAMAMAREEGVLPEAASVDFSEIILSDNFSLHGKLHYFFPRIGRGREAFLESVFRRLRRHKWLIEGVDTRVHHETGALSYAPDLGVTPGQRPWHKGMTGRGLGSSAHQPKA